MRTSTFIARGIVYYWRTHVAVVLGVAVAVAVLTGALVVGDSVRASLKDLATLRLGRAAEVVSSTRFFRAALGDGSPGVCPLIALEGAVTHEGSGRRSGRVLVYGVDRRFWSFHGVAEPGFEGRSAFLSEALAGDLGASPGATLLLRTTAPGTVPASSLFGRKEDLGRTLRLTVGGTLDTQRLGGFALRPQSRAVHAVFVPLEVLQRAIGQPGRVNTLLVAEGGDALGLVRRASTLEDLGVKVRVLGWQRALSVESESGLLDDGLADAARRAAGSLGLRTSSVLSYLANSIRAGDRSVPYSLVTALDDAAFSRLAGGAPRAPQSILLNHWAASDLGVLVGATVTLEYFLWREEGRLVAEEATFQVDGILHLEGAATDPDLVPEYPGITASAQLSDWDPPFPIDLSRVRPRDEEYWKEYRTTPKAFVPLARGQELWGHRLGRLTSVRVALSPEADAGALARAYRERLRAELDPLARGLRVDRVRADAIQASRGTTDFGEYFTYFSFFLVVSALLVAALFFRLGVEQRMREIGLLRAVGFSHARVRGLFLGEGVLLAGAGGLLGLAGAWGYGALLLLGLRTWWLPAVGTRDLALHIAPLTAVVGVLSGVASAVLCLALTLRALRRVSPRTLLGGTSDEGDRASSPGSVATWMAVASAAAAVLVLAAAASGPIGDVGGFFGGATLLLASALAWQWRWLAGRDRPRSPVTSLPALGLRGAAWRPGRSLLCSGVIATATFLIVAVGVFRRETGESDDPRSGTGGYRLLAETVVPLHHDPNTPAGREALNLTDPDLEGVRLVPFRRRAGDDVSCLNLYRPQSPTVLAPAASFLREGRFAFQSSLAESAGEKGNPWMLLEREPAGGRIPVIVDANSLTYVLHRRLGDELILERPGAEPLRLQIVGALRDSLFQGEVLMGERGFQQAFPDEDGFRFFLVDAPAPRAPAIAAVLESRLADFGLDVTRTSERLAAFHRVENTYLSTFQALGGLGLLLGTVGLATVILRNALERRRELALLRAVGYERRHVNRIMLTENLLLLALGLASGVACALVAVVPAALARGGRVPIPAVVAVVAAVGATGVLVTRLAVSRIHRAPLLAALRSE